MVVPLTTLTPAAALPPKLTVAPARKPVPLIVTPVPPIVEPEPGDTPVTVGGGATNVNAPASVPLCASGFVTLTSATPAACADVVAVIVPAPTTITFAAGLPPTLTAAPVTNPVPVIVSPVPPFVDPEFGVTPVTVGAGVGVT